MIKRISLIFVLLTAFLVVSNFYAEEKPSPVPIAQIATTAAPVNAGDTAWLLMASALVLLMTVPGLALFYGGMVRHKNVLSTFYYSFSSAVIVSALWVVIQYTLAFGGDIKGIIGSLEKVFFNNIGNNSIYPGQTIPEYVFSAFQMMFAIITVALISGAVVERMRFSAWCLFVILWSLFVYAPLAHWVWGGGWLSKIGTLFGRPDLGVLDFAGGLVVHISSGISALVAALYLGKRKGYPKESILPNNIALTFIGTGLLWFGWFGFNAGSAIASNGQAGSAFMVTNTAAVFGAITWIVIEWIRNKKPSIVGGVSGLVAGLATITPASGYVDVRFAILIGILAALTSYVFVAFIKMAFKYDDSLDAFGIHGVGGTLGILFTGLFANPAIGGHAGLFFGSSLQFFIQIIGAGIGYVLSIAGTLLILLFIEKVLRVKLRVDLSDEEDGLDSALHGEQIESK
jgi:Amt family ammonium transporter